MVLRDYGAAAQAPREELNLRREKVSPKTSGTDTLQSILISRTGEIQRMLGELHESVETRLAAVLPSPTTENSMARVSEDYSHLGPLAVEMEDRLSSIQDRLDVILARVGQVGL